MENNVSSPHLPIHSGNLRGTLVTRHMVPNEQHWLRKACEKWWKRIAILFITFFFIMIVSVFLVGHLSGEQTQQADQAPSDDTTTCPESTTTTPPSNTGTHRGNTPAIKDNEHSITFWENVMLFPDASVCDKPVILMINNAPSKKDTGLGNSFKISLRGLDADQVNRNVSVRFQIHSQPHSEDHIVWKADGHIEFSYSMEWLGVTCRPQSDEGIYTVELGRVLVGHISCVLKVKLLLSDRLYECTN